MRTSRGCARFAFASFCASLAVATTAAPAQAQLFVAAAAGEPPAIAHADLAYALGEGSAVTWLSLRTRRGPVAVVATLDEAMRPSAALDAWFMALEDAASPIVLPPPGSSACGALSPYVRIVWPRAHGALATQLIVDSPDDVAAALAAEGLSLTSPLPLAASYAVWTWADIGNAVTTQTLRIEGGAEPLALAPGLGFPVSLSAISSGPVLYETELDKQTLEVTFVAGKRPSSDYLDRLGDFLGVGGTSLLETRARGLLFDWSIYGDVVSVAPLVRSYAEQAAGELGELDAKACREQLAALREPGALPASACGDAVDAGLALGLVDPERATLQRFELPSRDGVEPALLRAGGQPSSPLLRAQLFDDDACPGEPVTSGVDEPTAPVGGGRAPVAEPAVVIEETVIVEHEPVEVTCGGSPQPEPVDQYDHGYYEDDDQVDCSADSSSSSDTSSDEDCSADSSSSSDTSSDEDCSADSSSSSDTTGDEVDCASDSSSGSDGSSDGCSGDSSSSETGGYDGETCTGSAAPRAERTSDAQQALSSPTGRLPGRGEPRPRRLKASAWALGFVALVLPIRRRKRGRGAAG